jgi:hypothetical protein
VNDRPDVLERCTQIHEALQDVLTVLIEIRDRLPPQSDADYERTVIPRRDFGPPLKSALPWWVPA